MYENVQERLEFIEYAHDERILDEIKKSFKFSDKFDQRKRDRRKKIAKSLQKTKNIEERNSTIYEANQQGLSEDKLAVIAGVSQTQINRIVKQKRG